MHTPVSDDEIWRNFRKGDKQAYALIYKNYFKKLYTYGRKFSADSELVKDSIQDLFTKLWQNKHNLGETTSIKNYLFFSFRRIIIDRLNQHKKNILHEEAFTSYTFDSIVSYESLLVKLQADSERKEQLLKAIQALSNRQQEAVYLKFYEDMSYEEVSNLMSINVKSTYKLVAKAIMTLRESVKKTYLFCMMILSNIDLLF